MESMFQPNQPLTLESLRKLESEKADVNAVESGLNLKADKTETAAALAKKADKTAVNDALELKADKTAVNDSLAAVNESLAQKADESTLNSRVSVLGNAITQKADKSEVNNLKSQVESVSGTLSQKADSSAVNSALNSKLNTSGGTMSGPISFPGEGTMLEAVTAQTDFCRIAAGSSGDNEGYLELATGDDGTESIICRQYSGHFASVAREIVLLAPDGSSNFKKLYENNQRVLTASAFSYSNGVLRITI